MPEQQSVDDLTTVWLGAGMSAAERAR